MKILFTFENPLPSADGRCGSLRDDRPISQPPDVGVVAACAGRRCRRCWPPPPNWPACRCVKAGAPIRPAALRHFCCGLTLPFRKEFRLADCIYTRTYDRLDHDPVRPAGGVRPLPAVARPDSAAAIWIYRLICNRRFLINICHSEYTRAKYLQLGIPANKLRCVHNGFEPARLENRVPVAAAKQKLGLPPDRKTVVYTGRVNHKKGLDLVIAAARQLPEIQFLWSVSYGEGPIEALARDVPNVKIVPFQPAVAPDRLYLCRRPAADSAVVATAGEIRLDGSCR